MDKRPGDGAGSGAPIDGPQGRPDGGAHQAPFVVSQIRESPAPGTFPQFEIPGWQEQFGVTAGITGRDFDLGLWSRQPVGDVMSRWRTFRRAFLGFQTVVLGNQIHGVEVASAPAAPGWIQIEGIDGWITTRPGILLTVTVADCVPVYLIAPGSGVALLHAGWRGTANRILRHGLDRLKAETGSSAAEIVMHCGVGICGGCYEVGSEVMQACGAPVPGAGPWHLDLRDQLITQARALGLVALSVSSWCSAHHRTNFYSHRASAGSDGRMVAYLGMLHQAG
jgi:YfiH family protein